MNSMSEGNWLQRARKPCHPNLIYKALVTPFLTLGLSGNVFVLVCVRLSVCPSSRSQATYASIWSNYCSIYRRRKKCSMLFCFERKLQNLCVANCQSKYLEEITHTSFAKQVSVFCSRFQYMVTRPSWINLNCWLHLCGLPNSLFGR